MNRKTIIVSVAVLVIAVGIFGIIYFKGDKKSAETFPQKLCFYREVNGDKAWLIMNIEKDHMVSGEFDNVPFQKDRKTGTFAGTIGIVDPNTLARTVDAQWNSMAEGMTVTEELEIKVGETQGFVGFGEMVDRGDGTYGYKDKDNIPYWLPLEKVSCDAMSSVPRF